MSALFVPVAPSSLSNSIKAQYRASTMTFVSEVYQLVLKIVVHVSKAYYTFHIIIVTDTKQQNSRGAGGGISQGPP